ncbi:MAG: oligosaccharide flippase family protein [Dehalococcoidia bacterium]
MTIKELVTKLAGTTYRRVFNQEMSPAEEDFVRSLSWVGVGSFIATALLAVFSILGGRLLGPQEYGKFTLIQSIAMFLCIPMLMSFDTAMLKYSAEKNELARQKSIVSTAYIIIAGLTVISIALMLIFTQPLARVFATTPELFRFSIYFAVLYAFFTLSQTTLRSVNRMRAFAFSQPMYAVILLIAFALFLLLGGLTFRAMVYSGLIAFAIAALVIHFRYNRQYFSFNLDKAWARTLSRFAFATIIAGIATVVYDNIGKIVITHYMTVADVGIYGAYFTATMSIASVLWGVFNIVFFPTASRYSDKRPLLRRINRLVPLIIVLGIPLIMGSGYLILLLYGGEYPFNILWLALFATSAILYVIRFFYASLLTSEGPRGAFLSSIAGVATALVSLGLSILLVPIMGISGAMVAAIAGYLAGMVVLLWRGRQYLEAS